MGDGRDDAQVQGEIAVAASRHVYDASMVTRVKGEWRYATVNDFTL